MYFIRSRHSKWHRPTAFVLGYLTLKRPDNTSSRLMMPPYAVWWILLVIGLSSADAHELVEFDVSETTIFSASLKCSPSYRTTDKIECQFHLKNNGQEDYSVLKWRTPLELTSDCLSVTRDGVKIPYDGISVKRSTPGPEEFVLVAAGQTVSSKFDVSEGYDVTRAGTYSIAVDTYLEYAVGSVKGMNEPGKPAIRVKIGHLSSPPVSFQVQGGKGGNGTPGQRARSLERENKRISGENFLKRRGSSNVPLDPVVKGGSTAQQKLTKETHRAAYHYIKAAISDHQKSPDRVNTWFGTKSSNTVLETFKLMERLLRSDTITYVYGGSLCKPNYNAYTWKGARTMHLCGAYAKKPILSGYVSQVSINVHELTHALAHRDDKQYGYDACKTLAKLTPQDAAKNADNYEHFVSTLFPFNYGIDAMTVLSNGKLYLFKGNMYVRYTVGTGWTLDSPYPILLQGNFRSGYLPGSFAQGFDSFLNDKVRGYAYATKGTQYIRYSDGKASKIEAYQQDISPNWGRVFTAGFDSMIQLKNGHTYVTKGSQYIRYSGATRHVVDSGYPKTLDGNWGDLPENFKKGFDAMEVLTNGKTVVFKDSEYIQYSDNSASKVDDGYPKPIKGNWGNVRQ